MFVIYPRIYYSTTMTSFGGSIAKVILCIWNIIFVAVAVCLILVGTHKFLVPEQEHEGSYILGFTWSTVSTVFIILGVIIATASLTGFAAAACESSYLLKSYVYFIVCGLFAIFGLAVANWLYGDLALKEMRDYFSQLMVNSTGQGDIASANALDTWQKVAMCCGKSGPSDWHHVNNSGNDNNAHNGSSASFINYPSSCCGGGEGNSSDANISGVSDSNSTDSQCTDANLLFHDGCFSVPLVEWYKLMLLIGTSVFLTVLILLLSLTCCLDRERKLANAKLINQQYASHLKSCIGSGQAGYISAGGKRRSAAAGAGGGAPVVKPIRYTAQDMSSL